MLNSSGLYSRCIGLCSVPNHTGLTTAEDMCSHWKMSTVNVLRIFSFVLSNPFWGKSRDITLVGVILIQWITTTLLGIMRQEEESHSIHAFRMLASLLSATGHDKQETAECPQISRTRSSLQDAEGVSENLNLQSGVNLVRPGSSNMHTVEILQSVSGENGALQQVSPSR